MTIDELIERLQEAKNSTSEVCEVLVFYKGELARPKDTLFGDNTFEIGCGYASIDDEEE